MLHLINNRMSASTNKNKLVGASITEPIYYFKTNLDGSIDYEFVLNTLYALEDTFVNQDSNVSDVDMREFFERYVLEADGELSEVMKQFDEYLANFYGEENLEYVGKNTEYRSKNEYTIIYS